MSGELLTIGGLLFPSGWNIAPLADVGALYDLQKTIQKRLQSGDKFSVTEALLDKLAARLDDPFVEALADGWSKCGEIAKYRNREKYKPEDTFLVTLADHTFYSEYEPSIDVLINNVSLKDLDFSVSLNIEVKGFALEIQNGKIRRVRTGSFRGSGEVGLEGLKLYERELAPVKLPGVVDLGEGVAIS